MDKLLRQAAAALLFLVHINIASGAPITLQFDSTPVSELAKVFLADIEQKGYIIADGVGDKRLSIFVKNADPSQLKSIFSDLLLSSGLRLREVGNAYSIEPLSDDLETLNYAPKYRSVNYLADLVQAAYPDAHIGTQRQARNVSGGGNIDQIRGDSGSSALVDRDDKHVLVVRAPFSIHHKIFTFLGNMDTPVPQFHIEGLAYEVSTASGEGRAFDIVANLLSGRVGVSIQGGGSGSTFKLSGLGVDAVMRVLDSDTRFKSVSRPSVRVKSGGVARFNSGSDVPTLGGITTTNGISSQSVEYRSSGVLLDVEPVARADSVDLKLRQEISSFVRTETGLTTTPTLIKRLIETELNIKPGELLMIGGVLDRQETAEESRLPFLPKLPFSRSQSSRLTETILILDLKRL
jgi:general secretion pathway protein D